MGSGFFIGVILAFVIYFCYNDITINSNLYMEDTQTDAYLTVEIAGYNANSYSNARSKPFFGIEILKDGEIVKKTEDFTCYHLTDRVQKVNKYSMQRFFVEVYKETYPRRDFYLGGNIFPEEEVVEVEAACVQECDLSFPDLHKIFPAEESNSKRVKMDMTKAPYESDWFYPQAFFQTDGFSRDEIEVDLSHEISRIVPDEYGKGLAKDYRFPYNGTGFLAFDYVAKGDADIYVSFDELPFEYPFRNCALNAVKLSVKNGKGSFLSFEPYTLQYTKVFVFGDAEVSNFHIVSYENPDVLKFKKFPDDKLDKVFRAGVRTFQQNAVDILTDCPSRERAGWLCDSYFTSRAEYLLTGKNKVEFNTLKAFLQSPEPLPPVPYGMIPMCYPSDHANGNFIANWSLWLVLELREYLLRTGDRKMIEDFKNKIYMLLDFFRQYENEDGLIEDMAGWVFIEWSEANKCVKGVNYPSNMLYAGALYAVAEIYNDANALRKAEKVTATIREQSFNGKFFVDQALRTNGTIKRTENTTETCQYYAFFFGIATEELYPELHRIMFDEITKENIERLYPKLYPSNAFIGYVLRLDYLAKHGRIDQTIKECSGYYLYMAEQTGTLWESSDSNSSCNHGFASVVSTWIADYYRETE